MINEFLRIPMLQNPITGALSNYKMTTLGKLFFASLVTSIMTGQSSPFRLSGDKHKIDIIVQAVRSSKRFQDEIKRPGATVDSVIRAMDLKNVDARNFKHVFGVDWPL